MPEWLRDGGELLLRSAALPYLLGLRWLARRGRPSLGLSAAAGPLLGGVKRGVTIAADELFFATEVLAGAPLAFFDGERVRHEVADAVALYDERGWLDAPAGYHPSPPALEDVDVTAGAVAGMPYLHLRWESGYGPWEGEPGRARWLGYAANRTSHAWLYRHPGAPRPCVVCLPAYRMGHPRVDAFAFGIAKLHYDLGMNVAVPVFPFHGPRTVGRRGGDGFLSGDFLDTVHAQAQAVWDARRLIQWLIRGGAPAVGIYGLSLGAYTATLLASLEPDLACVIAGIPAIDFLGLMYANTTAPMIRATARLGFPWRRIGALLRVISPLALPLRVPSERCYLFAGALDALAPPQQTLDLWRHWGEPRLSWYQGGHVSFLIEHRVQELIAEALRGTGLLAA
jgi:hypothetical protein